MDLERNANIAFMVVLLIPLILFIGLLNLSLVRKVNLLRRRKPEGSPSRTGSVAPGSNVRLLHPGKRRPQDRKKALFR